jgi:carbonic anhydrase
MGAIDEALSANQRYAEQFDQGRLPMPPGRKMAVLACMDARLDVPRILGLKAGEAHIIRNAGGIATEDAIRSLIISHHLLGTREFLLIHHTDCGMLTFRDEELRERLRKSTGVSAPAPAVFHAFSNLEDDVRRQIDTLRAHPWIPKEVAIRGFIYDVTTGRLNEVTSAAAGGRAG